jgi:hypothetical protein
MQLLQVAPASSFVAAVPSSSCSSSVVRGCQWLDFGCYSALWLCSVGRIEAFMAEHAVCKGLVPCSVCGCH